MSSRPPGVFGQKSRVMCYVYVYPSFVGDLCLVADETSLLSVSYADGLVLDLSGTLPDSAVIRETVGQLDAYFAGRLKQFELPLDMAEDGFTAEVWRELMEIPYGAVRTYGDIAARMGHPGAARAVGSGHPGAARAVGSACRKNPFAIIVPCHRAVSVARGAYSGYAGGVDKKIMLLDFEKAHV